MLRAGQGFCLTPQIVQNHDAPTEYLKASNNAGYPCQCRRQNYQYLYFFYSNRSASFLIFSPLRWSLGKMRPRSYANQRLTLSVWNLEKTAVALCQNRRWIAQT